MRTVILVSHNRDLSIFITLTNTTVWYDDYDSCASFNDRATLTSNNGRTWDPRYFVEVIDYIFAPERMRSSRMYKPWGTNLRHIFRRNLSRNRFARNSSRVAFYVSSKKLRLTLLRLTLLKKTRREKSIIASLSADDTRNRRKEK